MAHLSSDSEPVAFFGLVPLRTHILLQTMVGSVGEQIHAFRTRGVQLPPGSGHHGQPEPLEATSRDRNHTMDEHPLQSQACRIHCKNNDVCIQGLKTHCKSNGVYIQGCKEHCKNNVICIWGHMYVRPPCWGRIIAPDLQNTSQQALVRPRRRGQTIDPKPC